MAAAVLVVLGSAIGFFAYDTVQYSALRAKRAEAPRVLELVRQAELEVFQERGLFLELPTCPPPPPDRGQRALPEACAGVLEPFGWPETPREKFRCTYSVILGDGPAPSFVARASCDINGDGLSSEYVATADQAPSRLTGAYRF